MPATKCTDCSFEAVRILNGKPYCLKCFEEAKVLLSPVVDDELLVPSPIIHVGNRHPSTPLSELRYDGQIAWAG